MKIIYCAFNKLSYLQEAFVSIQSLRKYGKYQNIIYLITNLNVKQSIIKTLNLCIFFTNKFNSVQLAAGARLKILELIPFENDEICVYLDTDIIILKELNIPTVTNKFMVYGYPNRTQKDKSFAGLLTNNHYIINQPSINTGILIFKNNIINRKILTEAWNYYFNDIINNIKISNKWEQPYLCYKLCEYNNYEHKLNNIVGEERNLNTINNKTIFNHFCTLRGDNRINLMKKYLDTTN
ncbi:hypothetical protein crov282 [Cafeteria roenbergensis virus]|uniref:Nucleotide-diphospho-sugar transferase domain-containing protein n=1 Tax=Cafeteria roenbergensis virus (strain BV-PW1) TaxID=693272 RepID=E3T552_CROVB|nr:hypothetical protein crov282 [Cafeteria roenbergensis virus BV-PW1]ADO67315.1 hypothetical protein crov282 [Cafeteria roenbergensis virus BV-PW1]